MSRSDHAHEPTPVHSTAEGAGPDGKEFQFDIWTVLGIVLVVIILLTLTFELWIGHNELPHV